MKKAIAAVVGSMILLTGAARADEILEVHADNMVGGGFGGLSGFMLGAVAGPIGALVGGGLGYLAGQGVQEAAGLEQTLYVIEKDDGGRARLRTSNNDLVAGQQVQREGGELTALNR